METKKCIKSILKAVVIILPFLVGAIIGVLWTAAAVGFEWGSSEYYTNTSIKK